MKRQLGQIACTGLALLVSTSLMANPEPWQLNMTPGVTSTSQDVYHLHMLILWICVAIGVVVFGAMFYESAAEIGVVFADPFKDLPQV